MNKKLLALAALAAMAIPSISAKTVVDVDQNYVGLEKFPYYVMDFEPEAKNDVLVVANPEAIENYKVQYFVCYDFNATKDVETEYTVTASIKSDADGDIVVVLGNWDPAARPEGKLNIKKSDDFVDYTTTIKGVDAEKCFVIFQSGALVGTYEIKSVKVTHEESGETPEQPEQPTTGVSLLNDNSYWMKENAGEPALATAVDGVYTVNLPAEPSAEWDAQFFVKAKQAITTGQKYVFSFEAKSTSPRTVDIQAHAENPGSYVLWNIGAQDNKFDVTEDWKTYTFNGTVPESDGGQFTGSFDIIAMNLCKINEAGTISFKNIVWNLLEEGAGLDAVEVAPVVNHWTVYNLMGVKVLDTDNEAAVNELANGIYVINGKKVAIRK